MRSWTLAMPKFRATAARGRVGRRLDKTSAGNPRVSIGQPNVETAGQRGTRTPEQRADGRCRGNLLADGCHRETTLRAAGGRIDI
jgi:hypothetical protein